MTTTTQDENPTLEATPSKISGYTWPEADAVDKWLTDLNIEVDNTTIMKLKTGVSEYRIRVQKERDQFYATMYVISDVITGSEVEWTRYTPDEFRTIIRKWGKKRWEDKKNYERIPKVLRAFWD